MQPGDVFGFAFSALSGHAIRTRLTLAAVAVGVAAVLLLTALGESAHRYVLGQFSGIGSNLLIIVPGKVETTGGPPMAGGRPRDLSIDDGEALLKRMPRVVDMAPISVGVAPVKVGNKNRPMTILGTTHSFVPVRKLAIVSGMNLPDVDPRKTSQVCVLGIKAKRELFGDANPLGEMLRIGDYRFRVIGLLSSRGQSIGVDIDDMVMVPVANVMRMVNREGLFRIILQLRSFDELEVAEREVRSLLTERHGKEDFTLITQAAVVESLDKILGMLTMALTAIAAISLAVAGIGIMNVMLISVVERTSEIGLIKAVGASNGQVLALFLAEAAVLALGGGLIGVGIGVLGAQVVGAMVPDLPISTPIWAIEAAMAVALGVGVLFGAMPALKAARVPPVQALRGGK